jgi:uncharacterized protein YciI
MQQYIVHAWDGKDDHALERRMKARPSHFETARRLKAAGNYVLGGAMLNDSGQMIGSTMILQFESKEALQAWLDNEPYITGNVWDKVEVHPFRVADLG